MVSIVIGILMICVTAKSTESSKGEVMSNVPTLIVNLRVSVYCPPRSTTYIWMEWLPLDSPVRGVAVHSLRYLRGGKLDAVYQHM